MKKLSFTIAEILIAMTILGIIFIISTQTLQMSTENREKHSQLMKLYPVMDNMINLIILENMGIDNVPWKNTTTFAQILAKKLRIGEDCGTTKNGCWVDTVNAALNTKSDYYKFRLVDGTALAIKTIDNCEGTSSFDSNNFTSVCLEMYVDINSSDPPNKWGEDVFAFVYTKNADANFNEGFQPASSEAIKIIANPKESTR